MARPLARPARVILPDEEDLGPAMRNITESQRGFVIAWLSLGAKNQTEAAMMAGYGGTDDATRVAAKVLMRSPKVIAAIKEEADKFACAWAAMSVKNIVAIANDVRHKDSFAANKYLQDRAGLTVKTTHEVIVTDSRTQADILATIHDMAKRIGDDPRKLLGFDPGTVDAEFEEMSSEGLEDVL